MIAPDFTSDNDYLSGKGSTSANLTYTYEAVGCANGVCGPPGNQASVLVTLPPSNPSSISVPAQSNSDGSFTISWTDSGYTTGYTVKLGLMDSGFMDWTYGQCNSTSPSCTFPAYTVQPGSAYHVEVQACNLTACSAWVEASGTVTVTVIPATPTLSASAHFINIGSSVTLSWTASSGATSYTLQRETTAGFNTIYTGNSTSYTDSPKSNLDNWYRVEACSTSACSGWSNVVDVSVSGGGGCRTCKPLVQPKAGTAAPAPGTGRSLPPAASSSAASSGPMAVLADPAPDTQYFASSSAIAIAFSEHPLPSVGEGWGEGGTISIASSAAPGTQHPARSAFAARSTQHSAPSSLPLAPSGERARRKRRAGIQGCMPWASSAAGCAAMKGVRGDNIALAAPNPRTPQTAAQHGIAIHYAPPVYQAYANLHAEPASSITPVVGLSVQYIYTSTGYLQTLSNAVYPSQVFWTANAMDAFGQIAQETYGNGVMSTVTHADPMGRITGIQSGSLQNLIYQWDHLGNLTYRSDSLSSGNVSESFGYDILNRLTSAQVTNGSGVQPALTYGYDAIGDIISKSDNGSYTYGAARPHAVASVAGVNPGTYVYDANGNMTNRNVTTITWNSDNMPVSITQNSSNSSSFSYAPDKHRYYQSAMIAGVSETTVYVGGFEVWTKAGVTTYRHHLIADGREVAEVDLSNSGSTVNETVSYVLSDHLGSVDVVQTTHPDGTLISTTDMSFSAWGNRREPSSWSGSLSTAEVAADHGANRYGFTHQEMLDNVALIHMNGRVYDPNLGRFLSVDPVFEFPTNTQSLNPYSYVLNNPLSLTDPTGYTATDGSICSGPGGGATASRGCEGQDAAFLGEQYLGKLFGQLQSAVHKAFGKNATVVGFGKTRDGQAAMALSFGNGSKDSQGTNVPTDQLADDSSKGSPAATGHAQTDTSGASRLTSKGTVTADDLNRLKALEAEAVWHGYAALDDFKNSGKLPKEWQDFDPLDIFRVNYIVQPGFAGRESVGTCSSTTNGCTEGDYSNGTANIYGAALITARDDNLRSMTGLTLHEFEHSTSYNLGLHREFFEWNGRDNAWAILRSPYTIHDDLRYERDAIDFSNAAMRYYRP